MIANDFGQPLLDLIESSGGRYHPIGLDPVLQDMHDFCGIIGDVFEKGLDPL